MRTAVCSVVLGISILITPLISQPVSPRLIVILVVDQMRADYLTTFARHWSKGFRTLTREGAVFENAAYPYANTVTCAGHATVATGAFPHRHGIVGNSWWDASGWKLVDCSLDSDNAHVSYGAPAAGGNGPHLLAVPTIGEELERQRPGSRVVVLSLKPDTSVALAGRAGEVVTWFDGGAGSFVTSRAYTDTPKTVMANAIARHPFSEQLKKTWTLLKSPDSYVNADATPGERPPAGRDGLFPHEIASTNDHDAPTRLWQPSPFSDQYLEWLAKDLQVSMGLGRNEAPDLLAIGFSALDMVGHGFGPGSREVEDVLAHLDGTIGDLFDALDRQLGRDRYVVALTADHGVPPIPYGARGGLLATEDVQETIQKLLRSRWGPAERDYVAVRPPYVYFAAGIFKRLREDRSTWESMVKAVSDRPGVLRVLVGEELDLAATDPIVRAAALNYVPGRSGDLVVVPETGWIMQGRTSTLATNHGSHHDYDRRVPLILMGGGIRPGRFKEPATPADIAPTLASLVGITLERAEGRVLREALTSR
jgi:predicted AlkP superfamily pyrophosphatase or phosphodiesterase